MNAQKAHEIIVYTMFLKAQVPKLFPKWSDDVEQYKKAVEFIACNLAKIGKEVDELLTRTGFRLRIKDARTIKEVIMLCEKVWKASDGVLDLCP